MTSVTRLGMGLAAVRWNCVAGSCQLPATPPLITIIDILRLITIFGIFSVKYQGIQEHGILTKASTGGSRSVTITILSAVQCKSELLQFTVHASNCFSGSSRILVRMWLHDRPWGRALLWRITIHGMGGYGRGREGGRENHYSWYGRGREGGKEGGFAHTLL